MSARMDFEDALYELEQTTAILGFIQTAYAEGHSLIEAGESSAAIYMLYTKQNNIVKRLKEVLDNMKPTI